MKQISFLIKKYFNLYYMMAIFVVIQYPFLMAETETVLGNILIEIFEGLLPQISNGNYPISFKGLCQILVDQKETHLQAFSNQLYSKHGLKPKKILKVIEALGKRNQTFVMAKKIWRLQLQFKMYEALDIHRSNQNENEGLRSRVAQIFRTFSFGRKSLKNLIQTCCKEIGQIYSKVELTDIEDMILRDMKPQAELIFKPDYDLWRDSPKMKVILIGDFGVGKTTLMQVYISNNNTASKIFNDIPEKRIEIKVQNPQIKQKVTLSIWDTAGQEQRNNISNNFYRGCHGVLVVYDTSNRQSFEHLKNWLDQVNLHCQSVEKIIVGHNINPQKRVVSNEEGEKFAFERKLEFIQTSGFTYKNVDEVFQLIAKKVLQNGSRLRSYNESSILQRREYENMRQQNNRSRCCR